MRIPFRIVSRPPRLEAGGSWCGAGTTGPTPGEEASCETIDRISFLEKPIMNGGPENFPLLHRVLPEVRKTLIQPLAPLLRRIRNRGELGMLCYITERMDP